MLLRPLRMLLWRVKQRNTGRIGSPDGVPARVPTTWAPGVPLTRVAIHSCTTITATTSSDHGVPPACEPSSQRRWTARR